MYQVSAKSYLVGFGSDIASLLYSICDETSRPRLKPYDKYTIINTVATLYDSASGSKVISHLKHMLNAVNVKKMQLYMKIKFIIVVLVLSLSLLGCIKDFDLNPATTVVRTLLKGSNQ